MERIKEIWSKLEANSSFVPGLFKIRYSETSECELFLGIKIPEIYRILIIKVPFHIGKEFNFRYEFKGLKFEKVYDPDDSSSLLLNLVLVERQFQDIFDILVKDIIVALSCQSENKIILKNYSNRLIKWQSFFERFKQEGLTSEEQRGLFGELFFLRQFLKINGDYNNILISWVGSERQIRDFQYGKWSVEIKTTYGNNHQKIHISSERQLDTTNLEFLFLSHLSLEARQLSGESLNQIVDSIDDCLKSDFEALNQFRRKLIEAGFFDHHRHLYSDIGYFIRQNDFYRVEREFPRIEEADIRNGIGDVKYSIIISQCDEYKTTEDEMFKILTFI